MSNKEERWRCRHDDCTIKPKTEYKNHYKRNQHEKETKYHSCCSSETLCEAGKHWEEIGRNRKKPIQFSRTPEVPHKVSVCKCRHFNCQVTFAGYAPRLRHEKKKHLHQNFENCFPDCRACTLHATLETPSSYTIVSFIIFCILLIYY
jgi:hypothetical protein